MFEAVLLKMWDDEEFIGKVDELKDRLGIYIKNLTPDTQELFWDDLARYVVLFQDEVVKLMVDNVGAKRAII